MFTTQLLIGLILAAVGSAEIYYSIAERTPKIVFSLLTPPWLTDDNGRRAFMGSVSLLSLCGGLFLCFSSLLGM